MLAMGLCCAWAGLAGRWHWSLDIFANFYWQHGAFSVVALVVFSCKKMRFYVGLALATLLLNCWQISRFCYSSVGSNASEFSLHVLSYNVLCSNPNKSEVLEFLTHSEADIMILSEIDAEWGRALQPLTAVYSQYKISTAEDNFGLAVFSRLPLEKLQIELLGDEFLPVANLELMHQGTRLSVIGIHPPPPMGARLNARRNQQLSAVAHYASTLDHPVIVVGDMNATPWCYGMNLLRKEGLDFRTRANPCVPTWNARTIVATPIDHGLCRAPLFIDRRIIDEAHGSDHRAVHFYFGKNQ